MGRASIGNHFRSLASNRQTLLRSLRLDSRLLQCINRCMSNVPAPAPATADSKQSRREENVKTRIKDRLKSLEKKRASVANAPSESRVNIPELIKDILRQPDEYPFALVRSTLQRPLTIAIDYSSPNIAKPFHTGNWRSTILGNCIANLHERCGNRVERINYLGDWGTQFGILAAGFEKFGSMVELEAGKLNYLLDVYTKANAEMELNPGFREQCSQVQARLESGSDEHLTSLWQKFRTLSLEYYEEIYRELNMAPFNHIHFESSYATDSEQLVKQLMSSSPLASCKVSTNDNGAAVTLDGSSTAVRLLKSDGSSLYLSRDIAALKHRAELFDFDAIYYVVDNSQSDHFKHLFEIAHRSMPELFANRSLNHIKFGRIRGMSTRRGEIVKVENVIRDAKVLARERMEQSPNTRCEDLVSTAHYSALAAMLICDLKGRRMNDYEYEPDRFLQFKGDTGPALQYAHARLCSLERRAKKDCGLVPSEQAILGAIIEYDGFALANCLAACPQAVQLAYDELEPFHIVQYMFKLRNVTNKAFSKLIVIGERADVATARLTVYHAARLTLNVLMKTVGITPLERL